MAQLAVLCTLLAAARARAPGAYNKVGDGACRGAAGANDQVNQRVASSGTIGTWTKVSTAARTANMPW